MSDACPGAEYDEHADAPVHEDGSVCRHIGPSLAEQRAEFSHSVEDAQRRLVSTVDLPAPAPVGRRACSHHYPTQDPECPACGSLLPAPAVVTSSRPGPQPTDTDRLREARAAILDILARSEHVYEWPQDEQDLHRRPGWHSFTERAAAVMDLRIDKILVLAALAAVPSPTGEAAWPVVTTDPVREAAARALAPLEALFAGGPDTACRTTWHRCEDPGCGPVECVEVPMADLRAAFGEARVVLAALPGPPDDAPTEALRRVIAVCDVADAFHRRGNDFGGGADPNATVSVALVREAASSAAQSPAPGQDDGPRVVLCAEHAYPEPCHVCAAAPGQADEVDRSSSTGVTAAEGPRCPGCGAPDAATCTCPDEPTHHADECADPNTCDLHGEPR